MEHDSETLIYRGKTTFRHFAFRQKSQFRRERIVTDEIKQIIASDVRSLEEARTKIIESYKFRIRSYPNRPVFCHFDDRHLATILLEVKPNEFKEIMLNDCRFFPLLAPYDLYYGQY